MYQSSFLMAVALAATPLPISADHQELPPLIKFDLTISGCDRANRLLTLELRTAFRLSSPDDLKKVRSSAYNLDQMFDKHIKHHTNTSKEATIAKIRAFVNDDLPTFVKEFEAMASQQIHGFVPYEMFRVGYLSVEKDVSCQHL